MQTFLPNKSRPILFTAAFVLTFNYLMMSYFSMESIIPLSSDIHMIAMTAMDEPSVLVAEAVSSAVSVGAETTTAVHVHVHADDTNYETAAARTPGVRGGAATTTKHQEAAAIATTPAAETGEAVDAKESQAAQPASSEGEAKAEQQPAPATPVNEPKAAHGLRSATRDAVASTTEQQAPAAVAAAPLSKTETAPMETKEIAAATPPIAATALDGTPANDIDALRRSTSPIPGVKTLGLYQRLYSGFRNEAMAFQAFVIFATENNFTQILLPSVYWKDLFGTKKPVEHHKLFDVDYWNSFYPTLPRFVDYNETLYPDWNGEINRFYDKHAESNATAPYAHGRYPRLLSRFRTHLKDVANGRIKQTEAVLAMQKALRPHPDMIELQHNITQQSINVNKNQEERSSYMALHARIEPDMQKHPVCRDIKVIRLQDIFDSIMEKFPNPPVETLFIAVNRLLLEKEANNFAKFNNSVAVENLQVLDHARQHGLWNGTVQVVEAGIPSVMGSRFGQYPGISGAMMDYFLALESGIFVGTEVSSFSTELVTNRFYQKNFESYHYRPGGLFQAVKETDEAPPKFGC